jgi:hypothetical protein
MNVKKYMSFYDGKKKVARLVIPENEAENANTSVVLSFNPHTRVQDMSGPFPGMQAYEEMVLRGFNQPPALFKMNSIPYTQTELSYQGTRYYVDAASRGLGIAIDYLRTRYPAYFAENFIPMELEIADKKRAQNALHSLTWTRNHKVGKEDILKLREIAGIEEMKPYEETQKVSVMPPPSPRKTPAKKLQQLKNVQNGSVMPPLSPRKTPAKKLQQLQNVQNGSVMNPPSPRKTPQQKLLECNEQFLEKKNKETIEEKKEQNVDLIHS